MNIQLLKTGTPFLLMLSSIASAQMLANKTVEQESGFGAFGGANQFVAEPAPSTQSGFSVNFAPPLLRM